MAATEKGAKRNRGTGIRERGPGNGKRRYHLPIPNPQSPIPVTQDEMKQAVAQAALAYVPDGCVLGVGTGSTANAFIAGLASIRGRVRAAVASSEATAARLKAIGIPVVELDTVDAMPVYVDGADEVNGGLAMIKGGG